MHLVDARPRWERGSTVAPGSAAAPVAHLVGALRSVLLVGCLDVELEGLAVALDAQPQAVVCGKVQPQLARARAAKAAALRQGRGGGASNVAVSVGRASRQRQAPRRQ
jgi:hypothetical protein